MKIQFCTSELLRDIQKTPLEVDGTLVVMPFLDAEQAHKAAQLMASRAGAEGLILAVLDAERAGFISLINTVFLHSRGTYFAYVAQDAFAGRDWLQLALTALGQDKHFLGFNDGKWAGAMASFGLAKRAWAEKNYAGLFFHPQYQRHYADAELTLLALNEVCYAYDPNSVLLEVDWDKDGNAVNPEDRQRFLERQATGFDGRINNPALLNFIR